MSSLYTPYSALFVHTFFPPSPFAVEPRKKREKVYLSTYLLTWLAVSLSLFTRLVSGSNVQAKKMFKLTKANIAWLIVSIFVVAPSSSMLLEELSPGKCALISTLHFRARLTR